MVVGILLSKVCITSVQLTFVSSIGPCSTAQPYITIYLFFYTSTAFGLARSLYMHQIGRVVVGAHLGPDGRHTQLRKLFKVRRSIEGSK